MWVSKGLERALTTRNIAAGFRTTGIFPLNLEAVNAHMGPARQFATLPRTVEPGATSGGRDCNAGSSGGGAAVGAEVGTALVTGDGTGGGRSDDDGDLGTESVSFGTSDAVFQ